jgi:hypothetical protein
MTNELDKDLDGFIRNYDLMGTGYGILGGDSCSYIDCNSHECGILGDEDDQAAGIQAGIVSLKETIKRMRNAMKESGNSFMALRIIVLAENDIKKV